MAPPLASTSFGYTRVSWNSSLEFSTLKRTVEFMVTTVGGTSFGSTTSARSSSASSWSLPGIELPWSESIRSSRRSASSDETMIRGFDFVFIFQLPVRSSDYALLEHGVGDPPESGDVRPEDQVARLAELAGRLAATAIDVVHDLLQ